MTELDPEPRGLTRRELLLGSLAGAGLLAVGAACRPGSATDPTSSPPERGTTTPSAGSTAPPPRAALGEGTIRGVVTAGPLEVPAGRTLRFDPAADTTLEVSGNLLVLGRLEMRPDPGVEHVLRFVDVAESAFVGGGEDLLVSDAGLWVMGDGVLDLQGTQKPAWNRIGADRAWRSTDELVVAPVDPGDFQPRPFAPGDTVPASGRRRAEVLNLTRSVRIEGTPSGRSHVFIRSTQPQTIRHITLRYLGPRQPANDATQLVKGRYALHFHHCHDGSRGSLVEGVVARDCGSHAFVPHMSHGITIRDCIAYEVFEEPYWWDPDETTDDLLIDGCVAASVHFDPETRGYRLAGFVLGKGRGLELRGCVAFAVHGNRNSSGFVWPEAPSGLWTFQDNLAHNNEFSGIFVWQNVGEPHRIQRFTAYHNGAAGIIHGAYANAYHYEDLDLEDQPLAIDLIAVGRPDPHGDSQSWTDVRGGALHSGGHNLPGTTPVLFRRCSFPGGVTLDEGDGDPGPLDFVECGLEPPDFDVVSLDPATVVRVQRRDGTAFELTAAGVRDIAPFRPS